VWCRVEDKHNRSHDGKPVKYEMNQANAKRKVSSLGSDWTLSEIAVGRCVGSVVLTVVVKFNAIGNRILRRRLRVDHTLLRNDIAGNRNGLIVFGRIRHR